MARAAIGGHDVWVYRSDTPAPPAPPRVEPPAPRPAPAPAAARSTSSAAGWIGGSVAVMTMPFTLALIAMMAPALWIAGAHPRR